MSSFDAVFLHGVMDYSKGTIATPEVPNWKNLQSRLEVVERTARTEWQSNDSIAEDINGIAKDFDFDYSLEHYVDKANEKIDHLHQGIRDACADLQLNWDSEGMTRNEMVSFVESLKDKLEEYLPQSRFMKDVVMGWYGYDVARFIGEYHFLGQMILNYHHDDTYMGDVHDSRLGDLSVKACANGILRMSTQWVPGHLYFTSDNRIVLGKNTDSLAMNLNEFKTFFSDWKRPLEEEIELFDVLHPGADWTVFRYLRDYEGKNYVSNQRIITTTIPTSNLISVSTAL